MQFLFDGLGSFLAKLYDLIPNYAASIILLTITVRIILLPLGVKQVRSMAAMQALQPKMKQLQQKYKGNRQKQQEEMTKLYQSAGVNPLGGCLPMLLQIPVFIALFSVVNLNAQALSHLPDDSRLQRDIISQQGTHFLGANLLCSATQAGSERNIAAKDDGKIYFFGDRPAGVKVPAGFEEEDVAPLDCGEGFPVHIPYYAFAILMVGTQIVQMRQMQKANPNAQQQALTRIMPLLFGVWGFLFPMGLVLYWTTSNAWQIGQQYLMMRLGHIGEGAAERAQAGPRKPGVFMRMMEKAQAEQDRRQTARGGSAGQEPSPRSDGKASPKSSSKPAARSSKSGSKPTKGSSKPAPAAAYRETPPQSSGAKSARSRKKRRKR